MAEQEYIRLTRARRRRKGFVTVLLSARSSLWLGADHLLKASATFGTEEYRRFYFRDIQAITMRETKRQLHLNIALATLLILSTIGIYYVGGSSLTSMMFMAIALVLFGVLLAVNNIRGATCDVQLRTAVQVEDLPSLSRILQTNRILDRIRPLIVSTQGQMQPGDVTTRLRAAAPPATTLQSSTTSPLGPITDIKDADVP